MGYLVSSFIEILRCVSDNRLFCDEQTLVGELFSEEFDTLDFELAITCFEATHRTALRQDVLELEPDDYYFLTIEEFVEKYVSSTEDRDPLFVTRKILEFKDTFMQALQDEVDEVDEY